MAPSRRVIALSVALFLLVVFYVQRLASPSVRHGLGDDHFTSLRPTTIDQAVFEVVVENYNCPDQLKADARAGRSSGRPVQFIHIPKAGGTSVQDSLMRWAGTQGISTTLHDGDGPTWNSQSARGVFLGHRGFGFSAKVNDRQPLTIIALREPVSRIVSLFDYLRRTTENIPTVVQIRQTWQKMTLDEVVESYRATRERDPDSLLPGGSASFSDRSLHRVLQSQVQFLCGYECVWYMTGDRRESPKPFQGLDVMQRARDNLEKVDCVAVLNRLDDLIVQLKSHLDFVPTGFSAFPHENTVNPKERSAPSEQTLQLLREWTKDEQVLFERAKVIAARKTAEAAQCLHPNRR